jgi:hypothetical protein
MDKTMKKHCNILLFIISIEVMIISVLCLIYAVILMQRFQEWHVLMIKECMRQNLIANKTVCLV